MPGWRNLHGVATGHPRVKMSVTSPTVEELQHRYLGLMQISGEAVLVVCDGLIVFSNRPACDLLGLPPACEMVGKPFRDYISRGQRASVQARLRTLKQVGQTSAFVRRDLLRPDHKAAHVEVAMHACTYLGRPAVQVLLRDLSEQRRLQKEVARFASIDTLTHLSNRTHFLALLDESFAHALREGTGLGVVRVGLDNFRAVNLAAGYLGGDVVLRQVAERLRASNSRVGVTLARVGGDEFGLVLEGLDNLDDAAAAARELMDCLTEGFHFEGVQYFPSVSIGIALFPLHAGKRDRLLFRAFQAMKFAKARGGNQFQLYSADLDLLNVGDAKRRAEATLRLQGLTPREREVLDLLVTGKSSKMIAYLLGISARTIGIHRGRVMRKMQADSVAELVHMTLDFQA
jgi:diguanylate cyclase (GGDEF)-like protein/PAS domain S-box-containing protein